MLRGEMGQTIPMASNLEELLNCTKYADEHRTDLPANLADLAREYHSRVDWDGNPYPLPAWMHLREVEELLFLASTSSLPHGHIVEIGQGWGGSTFILAKGNEMRHIQEPDEWGHLFSFDPYPGGKDDTFRVCWIFRALCGSEHLTHTIRATSDIINLIFPENSIRLAFIDGDHLEEWAQRDLDAILPRMVDNGLILMHDVANSILSGPSAVWVRCKDSYRVGNVECIADQDPIVTTGVLRCHHV